MKDKEINKECNKIINEMSGLKDQIQMILDNNEGYYSNKTYHQNLIKKLNIAITIFEL